MSFHPPTLDPGPVATVVFLVLLAYYVVTPLLFRGRYANLSQRLAEGNRTLWPEELRRGTRLFLVELLLTMAFLGTALVVAPADIGWASPRLGDLPSHLLLPLCGGVLAGFGALLLGFLRSHRAVALRLRAGELPSGTSREELLRRPRDRREMAFIAGSSALALLSEILVVYTVLLPMLVWAFGSAVLAALLLVLLGGWQYLGQGGAVIVGMAMVSTVGLISYVLLVPGTVVIPLLVWGAHWVVVSICARALMGLPIPEESRSSSALSPAKVTPLVHGDGTAERD